MSRHCVLLMLVAAGGCATTGEGGPASASDSGLLRCEGLSYSLDPTDGLRIRAHFFNMETRGICIFDVSYGYADVTDGQWHVIGEPSHRLDVSPGGICMPETSDRIRELHISDMALLLALATQPDREQATFGVVLVTVERDGKTFTRVRDLAIPASEIRAKLESNTLESEQ